MTTQIETKRRPGRYDAVTFRAAKLCPKCKVQDPACGFGKNRYRPDGLADYCVSCKLIVSREQSRIRHERYNAKRSHPADDGARYVATAKPAGVFPCKATRESYHYHVEHHIEPKLGTLDLDEITYTVLKDWVLELSDKYSRNTVRLVLATLRLILEEAVREKLIASNPVSKLGRFARGAKRKKQTDPFALEQLHKVEATCHEQFPAYFAFVVTMARTGMRIGEAIALQGQDLDFERKVILIRRNMPDHREIETPKTESSSRVVDMSEQLVAVLRKHEVEQKARWLKRGNSRLPKWVFSTDQRTPIHYQNFRKRIWVELLKKAKVRYRSPHELRHTYASLMLSKGEDLAYVSGQLGHKNPSITLQIYTHAIPGHRRLSAEVLDWSGRRLTQMEAFSGEVVQGENRA